MNLEPKFNQFLVCIGLFLLVLVLVVFLDEFKNMFKK